MSEMGQKRRFEPGPATSGLTRLADIFSVRRHVSEVPLAEVSGTCASSHLFRSHKCSYCRALNQSLQQFIGVRFNGLTNLDKFHDVDTPFAAFVFGDEGLRSTKALGELVLCQAGGFARPDHQLAESDLSCGMDRFAEFARAGSHRRGRLIRTSDYPKRGYSLTLLSHSQATWWTCQAKEANCRRGQIRRLSRG